MQVFTLNAGSSEVNGTYAFAKQFSGIKEFWFIKSITKKSQQTKQTENDKNIKEEIYKIRGGGTLPQFGVKFKNCWILQCKKEQKEEEEYKTKNKTKQYYAAPMQTIYDTAPPKHGWICIDGIKPLPNIKPFDLKEINQKFDEEKVSTNSNFDQKIRDKVWKEIRSNVDKIASQEFLYCKSAEIYGGGAGLYDYGPNGVAIKNNIIKEWKKHFIIYDKMQQIESCILTPKPVLKASGHIAKFDDFVVKNVKTNQYYRADHLLKEWISKLLKTQNKEMTDDEIAEHKLIRDKSDAYDEKELTDIMINKYNIKAPDGNNITVPKIFNLMFSTRSGANNPVDDEYKSCSNKSDTNISYLRPETSQGIFTNFDKLLKQNYGRMPVVAAQIGHSFRNEIAPRNGLIRVREFQMAEIEHFCEPDVFDKEPAKFKYVKDVKMRFLPSECQIGDDDNNTITCSIAEACIEDKDKCPLPEPIRNKTLAYYLSRTQLFMERIGIDINKLRFRQHKKKEMAHYANDCWDAELLTSMGWVECVGHADRACYDLTNHMKTSGVKMEAQCIYKTPKTVITIKKIINYKLINNIFTENAKYLITYLQGLNDQEAEKLDKKLKNWYYEMIDIMVNKEEKENEEKEKESVRNMNYRVTLDMFEIIETKTNEHSRKYVPRVVEPSFGIGRILYALLEHNIWQRIDDENRIVLSLKPHIAPYHVAILPISDKLNDIATNIEMIFSDENDKLFGDGIVSWIDTSKVLIGKKYARCDQKGIKYAVTIDFQTRKDNIITLRERDSTLQIRLSISKLYGLIIDLISGRKEWISAVNEFDQFTNDSLTNK